jgi:phosphatidylglycerophosphate synthase
MVWSRCSGRAVTSSSKCKQVQAYEPTSRRPIAKVFRATAAAATRACVRLGIHPDGISYLSILAAIAAAICFWKSSAHPWLLVVAPLSCYLRLWFNMLDGMVALAANKASPRGEILNDLPDRISDIVIFAGVAHSGWMNPIFAYWAAIFAVLTAYVGLLGQAVGAYREFSGMMSKPWRMVALHLGAWLTFGYGAQSMLSNARFTILDWTCLAIIAGCIQTIFVRSKRILTALHNRSQ